MTARQITPEHEATFSAKLYRYRDGTLELLCERCAKTMTSLYLPGVLKVAAFPWSLLKIGGRCKYAGWEHE